MLENQGGIAPYERADLEYWWARYASWGIEKDAARVDVIRSGAPLVRPSTPHEYPGAVKIVAGSDTRYLQPLTQPCIDHGCRVYLWDDPDGDDFWIQHGDNEEAVRRFARRFFLEPSFPCSNVRPDVFEWVIDCHRHAGDPVSET